MSIAYTSFNVEIESRSVTFDPEDHARMAEIFDAMVFCEFNDSLTFDITLKCDQQRYSVVVSYDSNEVIINVQAAAGQPKFRRHVQIVPPEGAFGAQFQVNIVKTIPSTGLFKYNGFDIHALDRPGIGPEFLAGNATLDNGWE